MDSAIETALDGPRPLVFTCVEIALNSLDPVQRARILDGFGPASALTFNSMTFRGSSDTWGTIGPVAAITDEVAGQAGSLEFVLYPPSDAAGLAFQDAADEAATVKVWGPGAIDLETGLSVADPDLIWFGFISDAVLVQGRGKCQVNVTVIDGFGRLLDRGDGFTLNDATHKSIRSGEKGLEFVSDVARDVPWGAAAQRTSVTSAIIGLIPRLTRPRSSK
jgi:hypothetical protein